MTLCLVLSVVALLVTRSSCHLLTDADHHNHVDHTDYSDYDDYINFDRSHHAEQVDHTHNKQGDYKGFIFYADQTNADHDNRRPYTDPENHAARPYAVKNIQTDLNHADHKSHSAHEHHAPPDIAKFLIPLLKESSSDSVEILPKKHFKHSRQLIQVSPIKNKRKKHKRKKHVVEITPVHDKEAGGKPLAYILATTDADKIIATQEVASKELQETQNIQTSQEFSLESFEDKYSRTLAENIKTILLASDSSSESQIIENSNSNEAVTSLSPLETVILSTNVETDTVQTTIKPLKTEKADLILNEPVSNFRDLKINSEANKIDIERTPETRAVEENLNMNDKNVPFTNDQDSDIFTIKMIKPVNVDESLYDQTEKLDLQETDLLLNITSEVIEEHTDVDPVEYAESKNEYIDPIDITNVNIDILGPNTGIARKYNQNDSPDDHNIKDLAFLYDTQSGIVLDNEEKDPFIPRSQTDVSKLAQFIPTQVTPVTAPCHLIKDSTHACEHSSYVLSFLFNK